MVKVWGRDVPINCWNPVFYKITLRLECAHHISVIKADFAPLTAVSAANGGSAASISRPTT